MVYYEGAMISKSDMGKRIRSARHDAGFHSAEALARAIGVSGPAVRQWEAGENRPSYENLEKIAELTGKSEAYFMGEEATDVAETVRRLERLLGAGAVQSVADAGGFIRVPVYGRAAAGEGGIADSQPSEYRHIPATWIPSGQDDDCVLIEATGDSMTDVGIRNGDLLLTCPSVPVEDGDIAVVQTADGEVTVKRVFLRDENLMLVSENSRIPPRILPRSEVRWIGRVMWGRTDY